MRIGTYLGQPESPRALAGTAAALAARGLHSAWTNQHPGGWDPLNLLSTVEDGPAELGTAVVVSYSRHPVALATEALTTQALTGGRLTLGIGPGHAWYVRDQLGLDYRSPLRHTREYLEVLRPLLRGEHVRHHGDLYTVDTKLEISAPEPSVLLSALGPRMLELAKELADGTVAVWTRPELVSGHLVPRLGAGQRVVVVVMASVTADPDGLRETVARDFAAVGDMPAYRASLARGGLSGPADTLVAGTESEVAAELLRFREAGVTDLIVSPQGSAAEQDRALEVALDLGG